MATPELLEQYRYEAPDLKAVLNELYCIHKNNYKGQEDYLRKESIKNSIYPKMSQVLGKVKVALMHEGNGDGQPMTEAEADDEIGKIIEGIFNRHATYSRGEAIIKSLETGEHFVAHELEKAVWAENGEELLDHCGMIILDVNSLGNTKDVIKHRYVNRFLRKIAIQLVNTETKTAALLKKYKITAVPIVAGSDEFGIMLICDYPLTEEIVLEITEMIELEIRENKSLAKMVDFGNPSTLLNFMGASETEKNDILKMPTEELQELMAELRAVFPDEYTASATGGAVTLKAGLRMAIQRHGRDGLHLEENNFENASNAVFYSMLDICNAMLDERKAAYKKSVNAADPKLGNFLIEDIDDQRKKVETLIQKTFAKIRSRMYGMDFAE